MRKKQIMTTNFLLFALFLIYLIIINIFPITISFLIGVLAVVLLIQASYLFINRNSTKSLLAIFEQVAIYEKEKMGAEWAKQRKTSAISLFFLSGMMFINAYLSRETTDHILQTDIIIPTSLIFFIILITVNILTLLHIKKVDESAAATEFTGYTRDTNIIGIFIGLLIAIVFIILILFIY